MGLKIPDDHFRWTVGNKCLNLCESVGVEEKKEDGTLISLAVLWIASAIAKNLWQKKTKKTGVSFVS